MKRLEMGLSLRAFSRIADMGHTYLHDIECNRKPAPSDKLIIKLSDILNLSASEKEMFFDYAAESKGKYDKSNIHLPVDVSTYISENALKKEEIRREAKQMAALKSDKRNISR